MKALSQDIRFALRLLAKSPGLTAVIVLMLAIGVGMNSAIFSFANGLLLRPLAFPEMERLVSLWESNPRQGRDQAEVAPANFRDWVEQSHGFEQLAAFQWWDTHLADAGAAEQLQGFRVTAAFFKALGVSPAFGRTFGAEDEQPGREDVVVISHGLWQRRLGGDPSVIGRNLTLNGRTHTIVGIMPAAFEFPVTAELWMPLVIAGDLGREREKRFLQVLGRLKPGVSPEQARSEMKGIAGRLARLYPGANMDWTVELALLRQRVVRDSGTRDPILILIVAAGCVWLLGCANVANLQLASATRRLKELAIRAALGANPRRLVGQLLVESLVTGMIAGLVSLLFALACIHGIKVSLPTDIARYLSGWKTVGLDARVLVFALAAAALTGILCGIAPALLIWRSEPFAILKESARGSTLGRGHDWLRGSLVVAEVTLSLVLLICAGLVIEGFQTVLHRWRGFVSDKVLTFRITLPAAQYPTPSQVTSFFDRALEEMATLPGVNSAAFGSHLPFAHKAWPQRPLHIEGKPAPNGKDFQVAFQTVSPGYFRTLKIPLRAGRTFRAGDQAGAARVAVISESLARRYWPDEPVLGRRIQLPADAGDESPYFTIVGVVGNVRRQASEPDDQAVYCSFAQEPERTMLCALQTQVNPKSMIGSVRARMRQLDALQPITNLKTLDQIIAESMVALRVPAEMLTFLGLLTLLLAGAGIYSVLAYAVRQRTHEIGIRLALGAPRAEVLRMVIVAALKLAAIGISAGLPIAFGCGRVLSSVLFGTGSLRLGAVVCAVILLTATALLAALLPARQAISVDPVMALRKE